MARPRKTPEPRQHARPHGQGTVSQHRNGRWRAVLPPALGRRSSYHPTRLQAEAWLAHELGWESEPTEHDATMAFGRYLLQWRASLTITDASRYYDRAIRYAAPLYGIPLCELTHRDFQALFAGWLRQSPSGGPGLSGRTVRQLRGVLASACRAAVPDLLPANPISRTRLPPQERRDVPRWDQADAQRFLEAAAGSPLAALFRLALSIGARSGELRGLQWRDLDLDASPPTVHIRRSLHLTTNASQPTKTRRERLVELPPPCVRALRQHRAQQAVVSEWVFCDRKGRPLTYLSIWHEYRRVRRRAAVPPMVLHGLRHTATTLCLDRGVPLPQVAEMLGHATPEITSRVYWRHLKSQRGMAAAAMADALPDEFSDLKSGHNDDLHHSLAPRP